MEGGQKQSSSRSWRSLQRLRTLLKQLKWESRTQNINSETKNTQPRVKPAERRSTDGTCDLSSCAQRVALIRLRQEVNMEQGRRRLRQKTQRMRDLRRERCQKE